MDRKSEAERQRHESDRLKTQLADSKAQEMENREFSDVLDWRSRRIQAYGDVVGHIRKISDLCLAVQRSVPLDSLPPMPTWTPNEGSAKQYVSLCGVQIGALELLINNLKEVLDTLFLMSTTNVASAGDALIGTTSVIKHQIKATIWIWEQVAEGRSVLEDEVLIFDQNSLENPISGQAATGLQKWRLLRGYVDEIDKSVSSFRKAAKDWRDLARAELAAKY